MEGTFAKISLLGAINESPCEAFVLLVLTLVALWAAHKLFLARG